jgi:hypothetical protein
MSKTPKSNALKRNAGEAATNSISRLLGARPVLPGESEEKYYSGLDAALAELGAITPLQSYLVENIYDCLWWIRRYEDQKRATVINAITNQLVKGSSTFDRKTDWGQIFEALNTNQSTPYLKRALADAKTNMESLLQNAQASVVHQIMTLDGMIALKNKTLAGFQVSYEQLTSRKIQRERLEMQNALLRRDLQAIDVQARLDQPTPGLGQ